MDNKYKFFKPLLLSIATVILFLSAQDKAFSQSNDDCLMCHDDPDISMFKKGKELSLTVKRFHLAKSVHSELLCINCHVGFSAEDIPHKEGNMEVNCLNCHTRPKDNHPFHPTMATATGMNESPEKSCKNCHGNHEILSVRDPRSETHFSNSVEHCGKCHPGEFEQHLQSEHFVQTQAHNPNSPNCINCHKQPVTKGWNLGAAELKVNQEKMCLNCHINNLPINERFAQSLVNYEQSVHGKAILTGNYKAAVCIDCHGVHNLQKADKPGSTINQFNVHNVCGDCHTDVKHEYMNSIHGRSLIEGNSDSPSCTYCHGEHGIQQIPDLQESAFTENKMNLHTMQQNNMIYCIACHEKPEIMSKYGLATIKQAHEWLPSQKSHWETVRCVDCHSSHEGEEKPHDILPPEKTIKQCEECHSMNSVLMTTLYKHEKKMSREKYGFINGTILSDAYVVGTTRNVYLNVASIVIFGLVLGGIFIHGSLRWFGSRRKSK